MRCPFSLDVAAVLCFLLLPYLVAGSGREDRRRDQQQRYDRRRRLQDFPDGNNSTDETLLDPILSERLRRDLLNGYDPNSFPWKHVWEQSAAEEDTQGIVRGLDVEMGINFHKVIEVDVTKSVVDFRVWLRFQWKDPRLVWDPSEYGNLTDAFFEIDGGSGNSNSEIWSPDIMLWNLESGLSETLVDSLAKVGSDGNIIWSRPGRLRAGCKFEGLEDFPFDTLRCTMEFGSWAYSGKYLRPTLYGTDGYTLGGSETAGEAYAEFTLANVSVEENIYPPYPTAPDEDWPTLLYHVSFRRAFKPYLRGYVVMQILLNFVGFCSFWLPVASGERMALAITAVLTAVASDLLINAALPTTNALTWINKFMTGSQVFAFFVVFQCTVVIYFFYYTGNDLEPTWLKWVRQRALKKTGRPNTTLSMKEPRDPQDTSSEGAEQNRTRKLARNSNFVSMDANDFKDQVDAENNRKWQAWATAIDEGSRVVFPATYAVFLAIMFGTAN